MVVVLIILNIILIVLLTVLAFYIIKYNKFGVKDVCKKDNKCKKDENIEIIENNNEQKNNSTQEKVFIGRIVTEEEYQKMMKNRKSDISVLIEDLNKDYEYLKELSK